MDKHLVQVTWESAVVITPGHHIANSMWHACEWVRAREICMHAQWVDLGWQSAIIIVMCSLTVHVCAEI